MLTDIKRGLLYTIVTMVLFGGAYPAFIWGIGRIAFPKQSQGSLILRSDGTIVGSSLIAQAFTQPEYFHPRPSAVDYNATSTGGSNYSNGNSDHVKAVTERLDRFTRTEGVSAAQVPSEMVTTSAGGLDPHIPLNAAELQIPRIARARRLTPEQVLELVQANTEGPSMGVFGRERVNVLELNLALDENFGRKPL